MVTKVWKLRGLFSIRLVFRARAVERGKFQAGNIYGEDFWEFVERNFEPARIVKLRHETDVGDGHRVPARIRTGFDQLLERLEAIENPVVIPGIDGGLL